MKEDTFRLNKFALAVLSIVFSLLLLSGCAGETSSRAADADSSAVSSNAAASVEQSDDDAVLEEGLELDLDDLPVYAGEPYVVINNNEPDFAEKSRSYDNGVEIYGVLDELGRATGAFAVVGPETLPTESRTGQRYEPTGWNKDAYDGKKLYERCHLIAHCLTAENDNPQNLITGTNYLNHVGMLPHENEICDYVKSTGNHVLMRVVPIYEGDNLVASGLHMEAISVEDNGTAIKKNLYFFNVQPGITIDYLTGASKRDAGASEVASSDKANTSAAKADEAAQTYVLNTNSKRFHYADCSSVSNMKAKNRAERTATRSELIAEGYTPCGSCKP